MNIPITTMTLNLPMHPQSVPHLRGAVVEQVLAHKAVFESAGIPTDLFHNHDESKWAGEKEAGLKDEVYRYPLVQYKVHHRKAEIMGIGAAAKAPQLWIALADNALKMEGRTHKLGVYKLDHSPWQPVLNGQLRTYRLNKWLPLNGKNYERWQQSLRLSDKVAILDKVLWGHLFHLTESVGITLDRDRLELFVSSIDMQTYKKAYKTSLLALDVTFCTNLLLPDEIGLGQKVSLGFGKVQQIKKK